MSAKTKLASFVVVLVVSIACGQVQFNMGGVGGTNAGAESYLPQAESMGSNWQEINCIGLSPSQVAVLLNEAHTLGIRVFARAGAIALDRCEFRA